jgi:hypothetical protein
MKYTCSKVDNGFHVDIEAQFSRLSFEFPLDPSFDGTGDKNLKEKTKDILVKILSDTIKGGDTIMFHNEDGEYELRFSYAQNVVIITCSQMGYGLSVSLPLERACWINILSQYYGNLK